MSTEVEAVTEERTKIEVASETVTRFKCPVCEQLVEESNLTNVTIGDTETVLCGYCAESLFDIAPDESGFDASVIGDAADGLRKTVVVPILRLLLTLSIPAVMIAGTSYVLDTAMKQSNPAAFDQAAGAVAVVITLLEMIPVLFLPLILFVVVKAMAIGPRW